MLMRIGKLCVLSLIIIAFIYPNKILAEGSLPTAFHQQSINRENNLSVRICRWKNDQKSAISFTWDDNNWTVKKCSEIFDKYHFKCTFFINPGNYMSDVLLQDYRDAADKGFEIGNHGYTHVRLDTMDIIGLNKEIIYSQNLIAHDYKQCLSFAYPFHLESAVADSIIKLTHPFCRNFAKKSIHVMAAAHDNVNTYQSRIDSINKSYSNNYWIIFGGHGIDNNGYDPVPSFEVDSLLNYVSHKNIWVASFAEVCKYYLAYQSASIQSSPYVITIKSDYLKELEKFQIRSCEMTLSIESDKELKFMGNNIVNTTSSTTVNGWFKYLVNVDIAISNRLMYLYKTSENPPVSNAGKDQSIRQGATVRLDGSNSFDPVNRPLTYHWVAPAGITLSSNLDQKPTFTAPQVTVKTNYTFSLVVNNGLVNSSPDQMVVSVLPTNKAPVAHAGPNQLVNEGTTISLDGSASSDPDNDSLTYSWTSPDAITLNSRHAIKPTFTTPEVMENTDYTFTLIVNDGTVDSSPSSITVTVRNVIKDGGSSIDTPLFKIFPNPTQYLLTIEFNEDFNDTCEVSVSTLIGTEIFKEEINEATKLMIDLSNQVNGIYMLKVKAGNREHTSKIILKK
jgi:hypothetical protein